MSKTTTQEPEMTIGTSVTHITASELGVGTVASEPFYSIGYRVPSVMVKFGKGVQASPYPIENLKVVA